MADLEQLYQEAETLKDAGKNDEAIAKLVELLDQDESHALAHMALAVLYGRVNRHEDAVRHGMRATQLEPSDAFNFTALSVTYQRAFEGTKDPQYIQLAEQAMAQSHALQGRG